MLVAGDPGRPVAPVGGVDAPGAPLGGPPGDLGVHGRVGGGRHDEPRALEVAGLHGPLEQLGVAVADHAPRVVRRGRVDEHDLRTVLQQSPGPAHADHPGADDEHAATGEVEPDECRHAVERSMVTRPSFTLTAYVAKSGPRPGSGALSIVSRQRPSSSENTCL